MGISSAIGKIATNVGGSAIRGAADFAKGILDSFLEGTSYDLDSTNKDSPKYNSSNKNSSRPNLIIPKKYNSPQINSKSPLSVIEENSKQILNSLNILSSNEEKRQNELLKESEDAIAKNKEDSLESLYSGKLETSGEKDVGLDKFSEAIDSLIQKIKEINPSSGTGGNSSSSNYLNLFGKKNKVKKVKLSNGRTAYRDPKTGRFAKPLPKMQIKKLLRPTILKGLGKTAFKSIPIIGAGVGLSFAIGRLLEGDPVGATLDAASGLGGPVTAIPAFIASTARDSYSSVYGIEPEEDPLYSTRMKELTAHIKEILAEELKTKVVKKEDSKNTFNQTIDNNYQRSNKEQQKPSQQNRTVTTGSSNQTQARRTPKASVTSNSSSKPTTTERKNVTAKAPDAKNPSKNLEKIERDAVMTNKTNMTGNQIEKVTEESNRFSLPSSNMSPADISPNLPNLTASKSSRSQSSIPDPNYYGAEEYIKQLYWNTSL